MEDVGVTGVVFPGEGNGEFIIGSGNPVVHDGGDIKFDLPEAFDSNRRFGGASTF